MKGWLWINKDEFYKVLTACLLCFKHCFWNVMGVFCCFSYSSSDFYYEKLKPKWPRRICNSVLWYLDFTLDAHLCCINTAGYVSAIYRCPLNVSPAANHKEESTKCPNMRSELKVSATETKLFLNEAVVTVLVKHLVVLPKYMGKPTDVDECPHKDGQTPCTQSCFEVNFIKVKEWLTWKDLMAFSFLTWNWQVSWMLTSTHRSLPSFLGHFNVCLLQTLIFNKRKRNGLEGGQGEEEEKEMRKEKMGRRDGGR